MLSNALYWPETYILQPGLEILFKKYINPGMRFLDAGCGEGRFMRLAKSLGATALGFDISIMMARYAVEQSNSAKRSPFPVAAADVTAIPIQDNTFDIAHCCMVLMIIEDPHTAISELARVLRASGQLLITTVHPCFMTWGKDTTFPFKSPSDYLSHHQREWEFELSNGLRHRVPFFHRPLSSYLNLIVEYFEILEVVELPTEDPASGDTQPYAYFEYLTIRARKK